MKTKNIKSKKAELDTLGATILWVVFILAGIFAVYTVVRILWGSV